MRASIVQSEKVCFLCGRTGNLERHHIFFGTSNRKNADKYGLTVWLCGDTCHRCGKNAVHQNRLTDLYLKEQGQRAFEKTHTREEFIQIFGKSYL